MCNFLVGVQYYQCNQCVQCKVGEVGFVEYFEVDVVEGFVFGDQYGVVFYGQFDFVDEVDIEVVVQWMFFYVVNGLQLYIDVFYG